MVNICKESLSEEIEIIKQKVFDELPSFMHEEVRSNGFLAGGCFSSIIRGEEPNDYDIFLSDLSNQTLDRLSSLLREVLGKPHIRIKKSEMGRARNLKIDDHDLIYENGGKIDLTGKTNRISYVSQAALTFGKTQIVLCAMGDPERDVLSEFDMHHCQSYSWFSDKEIVVLPKAEQSIQQERICFNNLKYPIRTLSRIHSLLRRGWNIDYAELIDIKEAVQNIKFSSQWSLLNELEGLYV